jgi:hypothetical protein
VELIWLVARTSRKNLLNNPDQTFLLVAPLDLPGPTVLLIQQNEGVDIFRRT